MLEFPRITGIRTLEVILTYRYLNVQYHGHKELILISCIIIRIMTQQYQILSSRYVKKNNLII